MKRFWDQPKAPDLDQHHANHGPTEPVTLTQNGPLLYDHRGAPIDTTPRIGFKRRRR